MPAGRPRSETARNAILDATRIELGDRGYDKFSIDRVAVAAGVSKQTVYRWYPSKASLVAECLLHGYVLVPIIIEPNDNGDVRVDVAEWVRGFVRITQDERAAALIRAAAAASAEDPEIARIFQEQVGTLARTSLAARLRHGQDAGQIRIGTSPGAVAELIVGALIHRLFTHETITADFVDQLTEILSVGIGADEFTSAVR